MRDSNIVIDTYLKTNILDSQVVFSLCDILDEVHAVPTKEFRKSLSFHNLIILVGLTGSPFREDYGFSFITLFIPRIIFKVTHASITSKGYILDLKERMVIVVYDAHHRSFHNSLNLIKLRKIFCISSVSVWHWSLADSILLFSDILHKPRFENIFLNPCYIGVTPILYRFDILYLCTNCQKENACIFLLSKVGDVSLDISLPSVLIQLNFQGGSRRQQRQRLGRICRIYHSNITKIYYSYYYCLVTEQSSDVLFYIRRLF